MGKGFWKNIWHYLLLIVLGVFLVVFFPCCSTKKQIEYVDREVVRYETKIQHDTLINNIHDSVYHTIFQRGDTIYNTKYVERFKYRDKIVYKIDTCYRDSISTQIKESVKEKQIIPKWCYYCLGICILFIIFASMKLITWIRTRI